VSRKDLSTDLKLRVCTPSILEGVSYVFKVNSVDEVDRLLMNPSGANNYFAFSACLFCIAKHDNTVE
jgi:hypothetical protein